MSVQKLPQGRSRWRKPLLFVAALVLLLFAGTSWYTLHYSMGIARSFEVQGGQSAPRVLIATQGSAFKDAVVSGLVDYLKHRSAYIKVIDTTALPGVREGDWDSIVVIHTWEMGKPPVEVKAFLDASQDRGKLVMLATSGAGRFRVEGVDAISSASNFIDVPARVGQLAQRVDAVLDRGRPTP